MPSVRLLNHDPDPVDKHVIYKVSVPLDDGINVMLPLLNCICCQATLVQELADKMDVDGFISLDDFISHVSPKVRSIVQKL